MEAHVFAFFCGTSIACWVCIGHLGASFGGPWASCSGGFSILVASFPDLLCACPDPGSRQMQHGVRTRSPSDGCSSPGGPTSESRQWVPIPAAGKTQTSVSVYFWTLAQSPRVRLVYIQVGVFCSGLACDIICAVATGLESEI